jgi:hypothetical protein
MRITERIGGFFRPKISQEASFSQYYVSGGFMQTFTPTSYFGRVKQSAIAANSFHFLLNVMKLNYTSFS